MSKFKVGDRVTCDEWSNVGGNGYLIAVVEADHYRIAESTDDSAVSSMEYDFDYWDNRLKLFKPKSPVVEKTITVKSIEAGEYGNLTVYYKYQQPETLENLRIEVTTSVHTAEQLRDMAKTLVEIADFMDEQKK